MKWILLFVFSSLIVFLTTVYYRVGGHKDVLVEVRTIEKMVLIGQPHVGPYHKINDAIVAVEKWAQDNRIPCSKTFGEYLDDPRVKDEDRLRSIGGCVIDVAIADEISLPETLRKLEKPSQEMVYAEFQGAPSIGPMKVYPQVEDFMKSQQLKPNGPAIEVYEIHNDRAATTRYYFPFTK